MNSFIIAIKQLLLLLVTRLLLICFGVLSALIIIEYLIFPLCATKVPLRLQPYLPEAARILAQSSKRGALPEADYIALVGDSYAQGLGDWVIEADPNRNPEYHSAHLLSAALSKDVISFGAGGAGSISGIVSKPLSYLRYLNSIPLTKLAPPPTLLIYFYEGNDLQNNLLDLDQRFYKDHHESDLKDASQFERFISEQVLAADPIYSGAEHPRWLGPLPFHHFIGSIVASYQGERLRPFPEAQQFPTTGIHQAIQDFGIINLPDQLQGPPLELSEQERQNALLVFKYSLSYLTKIFTQSKIVVVYIPSPPTCYKLHTDKVTLINYRIPPQAYPSKNVYELSDQLSNAIANISQSEGAGFLDPREALRLAADKQPIHGPKDWKHFNKAGYQALSERIVLDPIFKNHNRSE